MRVVLDTNIVVSALINSHGSSARNIDLFILGKITPVFDDRIIAEYREVLARPKFKFHEQDIDNLMELLEAEGESIVATPLVGLDMPDSDDTPFLEVAITASCPVVTGNQKHFPETVISRLVVESTINIISPADFIEHLVAGKKEAQV